MGLSKGRGLILFISLFYVSTELSSLDGQLFSMPQYTFFVPKLPVFSSVSKLGGQESLPFLQCIFGARHLISVGLNILICKRKLQKGSLGNYEINRNIVFCTEPGYQDARQ